MGRAFKQRGGTLAEFDLDHPFFQLAPIKRLKVRRRNLTTVAVAPVSIDRLTHNTCHRLMVPAPISQPAEMDHHDKEQGHNNPRQGECVESARE